MGGGGAREISTIITNDFKKSPNVLQKSLGPCPPWPLFVGGPDRREALSSRCVADLTDSTERTVDDLIEVIEACHLEC